MLRALRKGLGLRVDPSQTFLKVLSFRPNSGRHENLQIVSHFSTRSAAPACQFYSFTLSAPTAVEAWRVRNGKVVRESLALGVLLNSLNGQMRGYASGFRGKAGRVTIADRARQNQAKRLWTIAISGTLVAGFIIVVLNTFQENMMFYITPSQALEKYYIDPSKNRFRLGGLVLEGSVHNFKSSPEMEFVVTDLANEILVRYRGALPDLFREGHSVVAEGFLRPIDAYPGRPVPGNELGEELAEKAKQVGCFFTAVEVLAKHDEKYMPKEVAAAIERNRVTQEAQTSASLGVVVEKPVSVELSPLSSTGKRKGVAQTPATAKQYEIPS